MAIQIQIRRDTSANWQIANPTLADGEIGYEKDSRKFKVGNGLTAWNTLEYSLTSPEDIDLEGAVINGGYF